MGRGQPPLDLLGEDEEVAMRIFAALLVALALPGCSPSGPSTSPTTPTTPTVAADPTTPAAPIVGSCYQLTVDQLTQPTNDSPVASCAGDHTAQTIYVGQLDAIAEGHLLGVDSTKLQQQVKDQCPKAFNDYVGGNAERRDLSRLRVVWFSPTVEQADAGAEWFRCDVIAFGQGDDLATLTKQVPREALRSDKGLASYGLCGTNAPGSADFVRVLCNLPHAWKAVSTISLDTSKDNSGAYPGAAKVSTQGEDTCKEDARAAQNYALKFQYGWEWPTADQWENGQHYGICWAPDGQSPSE